MHPKTKFDELVDIFAMGAEPSSLGKSIERLPEEEVLPTALQIVGKLSIIRQKLQTFYSELEEASTKALYWERIAPPRSDALSSSSSDDYHSDFVFPPMLWFESLEAASMLSLYWAIQTMVSTTTSPKALTPTLTNSTLQVWSGLSDLYSLFSEHGVAALFNAAVGESSDFTPQSMHFMWLDRARKVLQSVAFCTTKKALEAGPPRCEFSASPDISTAGFVFEGGACADENVRRRYDPACNCSRRDEKPERLRSRIPLGSPRLETNGQKVASSAEYLPTKREREMMPPSPITLTSRQLILLDLDFHPYRIIAQILRSENNVII